MVPERIEREILIDAPVEVVWSVITEPEHVSNWFGDATTIDLRPGGEASFTWDDAGTAPARVEAVEPPHFFALRWMPWERDAEFREANATLVEFSLAPEDGGTRLRVVESGWPQLEGAEEDKLHNYGENREGWLRELGHLRDYVATLSR